MRRSKFKLSDEQICDVKRQLCAGTLHHKIAAQYDINQGRIAEINMGRRAPDLLPITPRQKELLNA